MARLHKDSLCLWYNLPNLPVGVKRLLEAGEVVVDEAGGQAADKLIDDGVRAVDGGLEVEFGGRGARVGEGETAVYHNVLPVGQMKNGRYIQPRRGHELRPANGDGNGPGAAATISAIGGKRPGHLQLKMMVGDGLPRLQAGQAATQLFGVGEGLPNGRLRGRKGDGAGQVHRPDYTRSQPQEKRR
jgi:hypothetical protein